MKSNQKFKYLSENSFKLKNVLFDEADNSFVADVDIPSSKATEILDANDFYSFDFVGDAELNQSTKLRLVFDNGEGDAYELDVSVFYDGNVVNSNEIVIECNMYKCIRRANAKDEKKPIPRFGEVSSLGQLFGIGFPFGNLGPFGGFELPDFDEMVKEAKNSGGHCYIRQYVDDNGKKSEKVWADGKFTEKTFDATTGNKDMCCPSCETDCESSSKEEKDSLKAMTAYSNK